MRPDEAAALFGLVVAAYPRTMVADDTAALWLATLRQLDYTIGEQAVRQVIVEIKTWPALAHLHERYNTLREQAMRARLAVEREQEQRRLDEMPRPPLDQIPEAVALLERLGVLQPPPPLELGEDGACDDCGTHGYRYRLGHVEVCASCGWRRLKAAGTAA